MFVFCQISSQVPMSCNLQTMLQYSWHWKDVCICLRILVIDWNAVVLLFFGIVLCCWFKMDFILYCFRNKYRSLALKIIDYGSLKQVDKDAIEYEISVMRKLCHPNILQVVDELVTPSEIYLVMEYIKLDNSSQASYFSFCHPIAVYGLQQNFACCKFPRRCSVWFSVSFGRV